MQLALAKALVAVKPNATRARDLAQQAAVTYDKEATTPTERTERDRIHAWLETHPRRSK